MALSDIRVIDLTRILAGPFCTQLLGDMGAEVIKIESTSGGDAIRQQGAVRDGLSWYFAQFNRNKKSICLDLYTDEGKDVLARLLQGADVLVENFRPGVLEKMGFPKDRLDELNPSLVVTHINGYGSDGPYRDRPSFDFIAQAMSGFMSINGGPDDPPLRSGQPIADLVAGLYAAFGTVSALHARSRTGQGQEVESTLLGGLMSLMAYLSAHYFETGELPVKTGNDHPVVAPYGLFHASDGQVAIAPSNDEFVSRLFEVLEVTYLFDDPDYSSNEARMRNRPALNGLMNEVIGTRSVDHWIDVINEAGVPCGRVMTLADTFADPQVLSQGMVVDVDHGTAGTVRMTGFPVKLSEQTPEVRLPAPAMGEHTAEVLSAAGFGEDELTKLRKAGVINDDTESSRYR